MLKIVHLLTGVAALLLSFAPSLRNESLPYLQHADGLYLAIYGLTNLLLAPLLPVRHQGVRNQLQGLVSALLVLSVVLQALVLLAPLPLVGELPAVILSLATLGLGIALHLAINLGPRPHQQAPLTRDLGNRETGTVKWFNTSKGFGFISRDSGDDIFVHFRAIRGEGHRVLIEGQRVEFSVMNRDKGLQAEDVIAALPSRR
ncbi:cold-shock protein [Pseudomonas alcaligenes]|uniref:Cold-shock protein n=1 Tax=Aquipseudomonas alcaligenes TaxID=43263 RepID=A0ABR7S4J2_AQUAC|nr:cold-shock protein [Pseudomonas alcaligenes]MBC9251730.1 cold-shock protein [Pseudomonas alcaligenes]